MIQKKVMTLMVGGLLLASPTMAQKVHKPSAKLSKVAVQTTFQHPWIGKKVAYFGDSITDPNNMPSATLYWEFLQQWLGITPYVYGVSGREWNDIPRQAAELHKEHGEEVDAILIFCGTNDYNNSVPLGEWYEETADYVISAVGRQKQEVQRRHRHFSMNPNTFRGRINIAMSKLKEMYPTKQIVLMTTIHRAYFNLGDSNIQPDEMYQNGMGLFIDEYVKAIKEAQNVWSVPVIDLHGLSGLFPLSDAGAQLFNKTDVDRLHPNSEGHARLAKTIMCQLLALPGGF